MELLELVTLAAIASGITAVIGIGFSSYNIWRTETQISKQTKINSAQLSLELIKRVREKDFADIVDNIFDGKSDQCDAITLERFLNHFDMIAKFHEDKLLEMQHIIQIYGGLLRKIRDDKYIQTILKKDEKLFPPLICLYTKI